MLRTAGLVQTRKDGRVVFYRLADTFPEPLLEHCLRELLRLSELAGGDRLRRRSSRRTRVR
jgi:ArsR family transcriptional regulator, lead/cadmium/zinc/bismuth-responsive transcriptional repressor